MQLFFSKMNWSLFLVLASVVGISHSLPAPAPSVHYELGTTYKYSYQFTILLNENSNITSRIASVGRNVGYRVSSEFLLTPVWANTENAKEQLLKLELLKPTLHVSSTMHSNEGINRHWSKLDNLSYPPIYIHFAQGQVKKVYLLPDSKDMINIKKGIASLLQFSVTDAKVQELDVSGMCDVKYKVQGSTVKKSKSNCKRNHFNPNNLKSKELLSPRVSTSSEMVINLNPQASIIQKISGKEEVMMTLNMWKQAAVFVKTKMHLNFVEQYGGPSAYSGKLSSVLQSISKEMGSKLISDALEATSEGIVCAHCKPLNELVQEYGNNLLPEILGELKSAGGFLKVLDSFRRASKKELLMLFKDTDGRILTQLLDVLAAAQTDDALEVAFQLIDFESQDITIAERFLLCLATAPNPNEAVIGKTLKLFNRNIKSEKLKATIWVALSSLVRTYRKSDSNNAKSLIVENVGQLLLKELQECKDVGCIINQLLAMRNLALPQHLPILIEFVKKGGIFGVMALEAMKDIGEEHFTHEITTVLFRVYHQFWPHQESAARVLAAELLLKSDPSYDTVGKIILSLSNREEPEITTLVLKKLYNSMKESVAVKSCVQDLLKNTTYSNYDNLAQNGSSTSVINMLQRTHDANITYGIDVEMRPSGMLKRTSFDLNLLGNNETAHLMSLSLFVEGFGLSDEEQKENPQEHSAGMQLSVLGVHLRPYIFFTGTAELMGLVWSGAGNQPTPALQANFLLMDQSNSIMLQNGISVDFNLKGALSTDIAGSVEVSMWNKNAHSVVKNKGAFLVHGHCRVDTSFVESHVDFALGGSSVLDMMVDLDFGKKPMAICLQVEQPPFVFRHNVRKTETIPGSKHLIKTLKRRSMFFPGKSFNLFKKNSDSCKELLFPKKQKSFWR